MICSFPKSSQTSTNTKQQGVICALYTAFKNKPKARISYCKQKTGDVTLRTTVMKSPVRPACFLLFTAPGNLLLPLSAAVSTCHLPHPASHFPKHQLCSNTCKVPTLGFKQFRNVCVVDSTSLHATRSCIVCNLLI